MSCFCIKFWVFYLRRVMKPLAINKELVLMFPLRQVQDCDEVIMAFFCGERKSMIM